MKISVLTLALLLPLLGGCKGRHLEAVDNPLYPSQAINKSEEGFFVIRYQAFSDKKRSVGGTLNEIAIRNASLAPLIIETLQLKMRKNGTDITVGNAPVVYDKTIIEAGALKLKNTNIIPPNEWRYFEFAISDHEKIGHKDTVEYEYRVALSAGDKHYENNASFEKSITSYLLPWP